MGDRPSWDAIATASVHTKAFVPTAARKLWAQCLIAALTDVVEVGDERAWLDLYMLPKAVLRSGQRGGKSHSKTKAMAETKRRCQAWLEGLRASLWEIEQRRIASKRASEMSDESRRARAVDLARERRAGE